MESPAVLMKALGCCQRHLLPQPLSILPTVRPLAMLGSSIVPRKHTAGKQALHPFHFASIVELVPVQDAKQKREDLGVELYGFQQQLAKLQMQLEKSQEQHVQVSQVRAQARLDQQD